MDTQISPSPSQLALAPTPDLAEKAYLRVRPELDAVGDDELGRNTVNAMTAVLIMLGALPALEALRKEIEALADMPPGLIDKARDYAHALAHVQAMGQPSSTARFEALLAELLPARDRLLSTAELGVKFGLFDDDQVADIRSGTGHVDAINDVLALVRLFRAHWPELEGKVPVTREDVERAGALGVETLAALGERKVGAETTRPVGEYERARVRLLHLIVRTHGQLQRAVTYVRWNEGDADTILPSIFQGRPRRRRNTETPAPTEPNQPAEPSQPGTPAEPDESGGFDGA